MGSLLYMLATRVLKGLFLLLFFPLVFPYIALSKVISKNASAPRKLLLIPVILLTEILIVSFWFGWYGVGYRLVRIRMNLITDPIPLAGTGSMYPTFPKGTGKTLEEQTREIVGTPGMMRYPTGIKFRGKRYFNYTIKRGDIVAFSNDKTKEITMKDFGKPTGFVKRVIGVPGDTIEIRDGLVFVNNVPRKEPYTARARSTFGGLFISDCTKLTVADDRLFVLGDNRKGSMDSRDDIGLIAYNDIDHVLAWDKQTGVLDTKWRDASQDFEEHSKIVLNKKAYVTLLNAKRSESGKKLLRYEQKLEQSAKKRAEIILTYDDLSYEATKSGYTMGKALRDAGYSNIVWGEYPVKGYYEAEELIDHQFAFPKGKEFLLNSDYQDVGIAEVEMQVNECPVKAIVAHFGGYIPPNYKKEDIASWKETLQQLRSVQSGWTNLRSVFGFYENNKADVDRNIEIISTRITRTQAIVDRMEKNQWLTQEEQSWVKQDQALGLEHEALSKKINEHLAQ